MTAQAWAAVAAVAVTAAVVLSPRRRLHRGRTALPLARALRWRSSGPVWTPGGEEAADAERELVRLRGALAPGATVASSIAQLARAGGAWAGPSTEFDADLATGGSIDEALWRWGQRCRHQAAVGAARALTIASATGAGHGKALDVVLCTSRERAALDREVRALSSQARASAAVLVCAPLVFGVVVALADSRVRSFDLGPGGLTCFAVGLGLDLVGGLWLRYQVASVR